MEESEALGPREGAIGAGLARQQALRERCRHPAAEPVSFGDLEIEGSIGRRFETQVEANARKVAYADEDGELSYGDLNAEANRIGRLALEQGLHRNEPVLALMDEGPDRIKTFLGILKAGLCHVALDPGLPFERQRAIFEQSASRVMLVQERHRKLAKRLAGDRAKVVGIEKAIAMASDDRLALAADVRPDDLSWIVYTSGSTGEPKGVAQNHRSMLHDMRTYVERFHISREDRLSLLMSLTTMAGCFGALMALGNGATLCRIDVQGRGIDHMAREIARHRLTVWGGVASLFRQWMSATRETYPDLRIVWFGGEAVQARDLERYKANLSRDCLFINRLGSTETGCTRMYYADHDTHLSTATVPVGYEIEGQDVYLEDERGNRVSGAGTGELVVASRYISVGYWRRPDLTRRSFSEQEDAAGTRVYRTGDLARREADGCMLYLGRKDMQVKIRGHRVELAEVEAALEGTEGVCEAVVEGRPEPDGGHDLVAYIVPAGSPGPGIGELRRGLEAKLPRYMVPTEYVYLEKLPRAANGKIVRHRLDRAQRFDAGGESAGRPPRTELEKAMAAIWEEVLDRDASQRPIGMEDDFFDLGGHSLRAAKVINRLREELQVEATLPMIFDFPKLGALAKAIEERRAERG